MLLVFITVVCLIPNIRVEAALPFKDQCVKWHNKYRTKHQAGPVTWDNDLAKDAEKWAKYLADNNRFKHAPNIQAGESLYMSYYKRNEPCTAATRIFYTDVKHYDFNKPGFSKNTRHFTQVVWKDTKQIGAAHATRKDGKPVVVIRYSPPGNFVSKTAFMKNVLPVQKETVHLPPPRAVRSDQIGYSVDFFSQLCRGILFMVLSLVLQQLAAFLRNRRQ